MNSKILYTDLKTYCDNSKLLYIELSQMTGINYRTLFNVIKGHSKPGKRLCRVLDRFITSHESEIRAALNKTA